MKVNVFPEKQEKIVMKQKDFILHLSGYQTTLNSALEKLKNERIVTRIWEHDHTVWKAESNEISNRLGWLHSQDVMIDAVDKIQKFVD